jgi:hypothetical protein
VPARALIDSGCIGNFLSPQFARKHSTITRKKNEPFPLIAIDGKPVTYNKGMVTHETNRLPLRMGRHREMLQFDITEAPGCDMVLGLPWLKESNPKINWKEGTIHFEGETPTPIPMPVVRAALDIDDIIAMTANEALEIIEKRPETMQILYCKKVAESKPPLKIPVEYQDFKGLFEIESD